MSDEQDSWFQNAFGFDVGGAAQAIKDQASAMATQAESAVTQVVQGVQGAAETVIDGAVGAVTGVVKKAAGAVGLGDGGGTGGGAPAASGAGEAEGGAFPLRASVGRGGKNQPGDVKAVQAALGIAADGQCGGQTIAAIEAFQRNQGLPKVDGRVDPGGSTEKALSSGGGAPPAAAATGAASSDQGDQAADGGVLGALGSLAGDVADAASGAVEQVADAASDLGGQLQQGAAAGEGDDGGGPSAAAFLNPLPTLRRLLPNEAIECHKYLIQHKFQAFINPLGNGRPISGFDPGLDGKPTTFAEVVRQLGELTLLNPVDELNQLVLERYRELCSGGAIAPDAGGGRPPPILPPGLAFAPTTLIARGGPGRVRLLWKGVKGASAYKIYRSEVSGTFGSGPLREVRGSTTFTDTGVTDGTTYHYHVTSVTDAGESGSSPEASATPAAAVGPEAEAEAGPGDEDEGENAITQKTTVKWKIAFSQVDDGKPVQLLDGAELQAEVDQAGNAGSVEGQLNIIRARLEGRIKPVGKVEIEAVVGVVAKGKLGDRIFSSVEFEVKSEVEVKLHQISLKAAAKADPSGKIHPEFAVVLWRW